MTRRPIGARACAIGLAACMTVTAAQAQDGGFNDDLQTGLDEIVIQPLSEDDALTGFDDIGGLTLEELQSLEVEGFQRELSDITTEIQERVVAAPAASLRALDKLTGEVADLDIAVGSAVDFGRISVHLADCRYPEGNRSGNAYAYVVVRAVGVEAPVFSGWMIASAPALNAMDHQRYDIWPLTCTTS